MQLDPHVRQCPNCPVNVNTDPFSPNAKTSFAMALVILEPHRSPYVQGCRLQTTGQPQEMHQLTPLSPRQGIAPVGRDWLSWIAASALQSVRL
jgi:hypothetical protein